MTEVYGDYAQSILACEYWFRQLKDGDFALNDKECTGQPKMFADIKLEALLNVEQCQMLNDLE